MSEFIKGFQTEDGVKQYDYEALGNLPNFPTKLPNPNPLTFKGAVSAVYDGSSATTVIIPEPTVEGVKSINGKTGDVLLSAQDLEAVPITTTINGKPLSSDIVLTAQDVGVNDYSLPTASSLTLGGVKIGSNINILDGIISVPNANGTTAGVTIVYPAASCTTFSSDTGTVTPLAVQKGAKQFAIPRTTSTDKAIVRFNGTSGEVQNSKIIIEDVTNTRDTSKKAQIIAIPAEGGKKMVYGYCTDQVDGTSFIGGLFASDATSFPYSEGLAIGGSSGNLLWKGAKIATEAENKAYTDSKIAALVNGAPETLDTLKELADALGSENFSTSVIEQISKKANSSVTITAGNGLTGGGDLTSDRTLNVVGGAGILVTADSVALATVGTAGTYGPLENVSGTNDSTIKIPQITIDAYGRVTAVVERIYTSKDSNTTYETATQTADGLMSASDKQKLDDIETGANKVTVDPAISSTSTNPVQNKIVYAAIEDAKNEILASFLEGEW